MPLIQQQDIGPAADWADRAAAPPRAHFLIGTVALAANGLARRDERAEGWDTNRLRPDATAEASRCAAPSGAGSSRGDWFGFA